MPILTDCFNDPSFKKLAKLLKSYPDAIELIKTAAVDPVYGDELPDTAFADQNGRKFPIHEPAHAALSYLYATDSSVPSSIKTAVKEACDAYGIAIPTIKTAAAIDDKFYLLPEDKRWSVKTANDVKLASEAIAEATTMPVTQRVQAAVRLMTKAAELDVPVNVAVEKLSGCVRSDLTAVKEWLEVRSMIANNEANSTAYRNMADKLASVKLAESHDRKSLIKLAQAISELDEKAEVEKFYGHSIPDAVLTVFNTTKLAEEQVNVGGRDVSMSRLLDSPADLYGDIFGEDFQSSVAPDGDLDPDALGRELRQMPRDLQNVLLDNIGYRR